MGRIGCRAHDGGKGLLSLLATGRKIAWLEPMPSNVSSGKVELYRVLRSRFPQTGNCAAKPQAAH
jgi:hypothetical protein